MIPISKMWDHIFTPKYQPQGFSKCKLSFARIKGDILQVFSLKQRQNPLAYTIDFGIFPLCASLPVFLDCGGYDMRAFRVELLANGSGWVFDSKSNESKKQCLETISQTIDSYLIPLFDRCSDCKTTLFELIKLEELFDLNRQEALYYLGDSDCAIPQNERSVFDSRKYFMALKAHDYSYAHSFLQRMVNYYDVKVKCFHSENSPQQPATVMYI